MGNGKIRKDAYTFGDMYNTKWFVLNRKKAPTSPKIEILIKTKAEAIIDWIFLKILLIIKKIIFLNFPKYNRNF